MSEGALPPMRQRLERGRRPKAQRGALFPGVPRGEGRRPTGEVACDPEAQARAVIQRLFEPFAPRGSLSGLFPDRIRHHSWLPVRARSGPQKGQWPWRRPS
jgi:hypothetical protein